jgi:hypothetical protein
MFAEYAMPAVYPGLSDGDSDVVKLLSELVSVTAGEASPGAPPVLTATTSRFPVVLVNVGLDVFVVEERPSIALELLTTEIATGYVNCTFAVNWMLSPEFSAWDKPSKMAYRTPPDGGLPEPAASKMPTLVIVFEPAAVMVPTT